MCRVLLGVKRIFERIVQLFVQKGKKKRVGSIMIFQLTLRTVGSVLIETNVAVAIWHEGLLQSGQQTACFVLVSRQENIKGTSFIQEKRKNN